MSKCTECGGEGGRTYGHYDQGWAECRYCNGTGGPQKWARCRECNKFGEVPDRKQKDGMWPGVKKCDVCKGKKTLPLHYYDPPHPLDIE